MDREKVRAVVVETLREFLHEDVVFGDDTDPMNDLGLESVDGILLAPRLGEKLGFRIPDKENPLVDAEKGRGRKVGEIVDLLMKLAAEEKEAKHA